MTVVVIIIRFLTLGGILFLAAWLYFYMLVRVFNVFAVLGGYVVTIIIHIILARKEK